jgi:hypothetical protein
MRTGLRRCALIGLVGGLLTGPTMLVWLSVSESDTSDSIWLTLTTRAIGPWGPG